LLLEPLAQACGRETVVLVVKSNRVLELGVGRQTFPSFQPKTMKLHGAGSLTSVRPARKAVQLLELLQGVRFDRSSQRLFHHTM
jgi:hypothetical protein